MSRLKSIDFNSQRWCMDPSDIFRDLVGRDFAFRIFGHQRLELAHVFGGHELDVVLVFIGGDD